MQTFLNSGGIARKPGRLDLSAMVDRALPCGRVMHLRPHLMIGPDITAMSLECFEVLRDR